MLTIEYLDIQKQLLKIEYDSTVNEDTRACIKKKLDYIESRIKIENDFFENEIDAHLLDM